MTVESVATTNKPVQVIRSNTKASQPVSSAIAYAEEMHWLSIYKNIGDTALAMQLIQNFDTDPGLKRCHQALYLNAWVTLRKYQNRKARAKQISNLISTVVIGPFRIVGKLFKQTWDMALECLPETEEPAKAQVRDLKPELATRKKEFEHGSVTEQRDVLPVIHTA